MTDNHDQTPLEDRVKGASQPPSKAKIGKVDAGGAITYSLLVGSLLDYSAGLDMGGIVVSRASATGLNFLTGTLYGWWREQVFKATRWVEDSALFREYVADPITSSTLYTRAREKTLQCFPFLEGRHYVRDALADLLAFNSFQVPVYATALAIGSYVSDGQIDWQKVSAGSLHLAEISWLIGPTMGMYMNLFRKMFGIKSAAEGAYTQATEANKSPEDGYAA